MPIQNKDVPAPTARRSPHPAVRTLIRLKPIMAAPVNSAGTTIYLSVNSECSNKKGKAPKCYFASLRLLLGYVLCD